MTESDARQLQKSPSYGREPETPQVGEALDVLDFELAEVEAHGRPSLGLFGVAKVGSHYAEMYGGRLAGAATILAVDELTGLVYHATPERMDAALLQPVIHPPGALEQMDAVTSSIESCFSVDLAEHLGLPPSAGRFRVALWLDALCSRVLTCEVPQDLERGLLVSRPSLEVSQLSYQAEGDPPESTAERLVLGAVSAASLGDVAVETRLHQASLPKDDQQLVTMTGCLRGHLDRELAWCTWRATAGQLRAAGGVVSLRPFGAEQLAARPQAWFVALLVDGAMGTVQISAP